MSHPPAVAFAATGRMSAALGLILCLSGCSAAGFLTGSVVDHNAGKGQASHLLRTGKGARVTLWLRDGNKVQGRLAGFSGLPDSSHLERGASLPSGASILIDSEGRRSEYSAGDVRRVSISTWRFKGIFTLIGIYADVALFFAFLNSFS